METSLGRARNWTYDILPLIWPRPNSGRLWLDLLFLLLVGALHHTVLPALTGGLFIIDLMTPWLVTGFVTQSLPRSLIMLLVGSIILETHSAAPAGLYVCAYWVAANVILMVRTTLFWRHLFPWLSTFFLAQVWVIGFESFYQVVGGEDLRLDGMAILQMVLRLFLSVGLGLLLCHRFMKVFPTSETIQRS